MATDSYIHLAKPGAPGSPLIFTFHGTGADEHQFPGLMEQMLPDAMIISPRGDVSEFGANRFFKRTSEGVYDMVDLAKRTDRMTRFISAHVNANPNREVMALGYSNGANILASVLFGTPSLFSRAALLHPLIPWTPKAQPGLGNRRILVTAGNADPICPWPVTERLLSYFEAQGADVETVVHAGGHEVRQEELSAVAGFLTGADRNAA